MTWIMMPHLLHSSLQLIPLTLGGVAMLSIGRLVFVEWHPTHNWRQPSAVLTLNHVRNVARHADHLTTRARSSGVLI